MSFNQPMINVQFSFLIFQIRQVTVVIPPAMEVQEWYRPKVRGFRDNQIALLYKKKIHYCTRILVGSTFFLFCMIYIDAENAIITCNNWIKIIYFLWFGKVRKSHRKWLKFHFIVCSTCIIFLQTLGTIQLQKINVFSCK